MIPFAKPHAETPKDGHGVTLHDGTRYVGCDGTEWSAKYGADTLNEAFRDHPVVKAARDLAIAHLTKDPVAKAEAVVALIDAFKETK